MSTITTPILVMAVDQFDYERFIREAGFLPGETKRISTISDIYGFKDKVLLWRVGWIETGHDIVDYARSHGCRVVRV